MMTKERFTTDNGSHEDVCLVDNLTKKEYESNFEDIVSLMNDIWNQTQRFEKHNQRLEKENEQLKQQLSDIDGQLVMLDNCDNWDYDRMKHTVREIAEIIGYNGTINPKR